MKLNKFIVLCFAGLGTSWFFYPTVKVLKYAIPIFLSLVFIISSFKYCCSRFPVNREIIETIVTNRVTERVINIKIITNEIYRTVILTNFVTATDTKYVTNTKYIVEYVAISPIVNSNNQRIVQLYDKTVLADVKRDDDNLTIVFQGGVWTIDLAEVAMTQSTLASIPYRKSYDTKIYVASK